MPEIISREEAKERGLKRYFTGKQCKYGHFAERRTIGHDCIACDALKRKSEASKNAKTKWRKEKEKLYLRKYRAEGRLPYTGKDRERDRRKRIKNPEKYKKISRNWYLNGPSNPKGELQWLRKNRAQLRNVKRLLKNLRHGLRPSPNSAFMTPTDSPK